MNSLLTTDPARSFWDIRNSEDLVLLLVLGVVLLGLILIGLMAVNLLLVLRRLLPPPPETEPRTLWQRITGLRPLAQEPSLTMEHAYDGIHELDNPTPPWFMGLFYGTLGFGVVYLLIFHVLKTGDLQGAEYRQEIALAEVERAAYIQKVAGSINENTVKLTTDAEALAAGQGLYTQYCVACHGGQGQGGVGPNLTDAYWLHGGSVKAVFHTITEGVPDKGMLSWKKQLNPLQVQQLASYILSLQGTNPAGAKEPQGTKEEPPLASRSVTPG